MERQTRKPIVWVAGTREDLSAFPRSVKVSIGFALHQAQRGKKHPDAKPLGGFGDAGVLEIIADHSGNTYRGVYTVRFERCVYVLHVFQKKSKKGIKTPKRDIGLVRQRLRWARRHYESWTKSEG
jgi:phage-related protein